MNINLNASSTHPDLHSRQLMGDSERVAAGSLAANSSMDGAPGTPNVESKQQITLAKKHSYCGTGNRVPLDTFFNALVIAAALVLCIATAGDVARTHEVDVNDSQKSASGSSVWMWLASNDK